MNLAREATKPKKISTSDRVAERLITLIREGWVKPGDRLPSEHELMARLGVGRSSVREAIRGLAMAGVLEAKPRRGTVVVSNVVNELSENLNRYATYWAMKDLFELRGVLEGHAAAMAARRGTPSQIEAIEKSHEKMLRAIRAGRSHQQTNTEFHVSIARAAQNNALVYCLSSVIGSYRESQEELDRIDSVPEEDVADHERILAAIKLRNADRAGRAMKRHLRNTIGRLEKPTA